MRYLLPNICLSLALLFASVSFAFAADPFQLIDLTNSSSKASTADMRDMTKDGNYVLFSSSASNLGVTNGVAQLFVRNRLTNTTEMVSIMPDGSQRTSNEVRGYISGDGRYISFTDDTNIYLRDRQLQSTSIIFTGDNRGLQYMTPDARYFILRASTNGGVSYNLWLYDRQMSTYEALGVDSNGTEANRDVNGGVVSDDGRFAVFSTSSALAPDDTNNTYDVYIRDRVAGTTSIVYYGLGNVIPNNQSLNAYISGNGRYVVYSSGASNLISGDTNGQFDIFLVDRQNATIERESITTAGTQTTDISDDARVSDDGRYVLFTSQASNLNPYGTTWYTPYLRDRTLAKTELIGQNPFCKTTLLTDHSIAFSNDGRYVAFSTTGKASLLDLSDNSNDVYLRDRMVAFGKLSQKCK